MKASLAIKSLIGIGVCGGIIGGSAYALIPSNTKNVIAEKLTKEKYTILTSDTTNKSKWDEIILSYKAESTSENLKFANFKGDEANAVAKLQKICSDLLKPSKEKTLNQDNYKKAEKWCVEPITVSKILEKRGIKGLSLSEPDSPENKNKWKTKITAHKSEPLENKKITGLQLSTGRTEEDSDIQKIKKECTTMSTKKNHEEQYDLSLNHFKSWCSE